MKDKFFQLINKISEQLHKLMKKPLFFEIIIGTVFSFVIIVISVSGFEKEVYKEEFDTITLQDNVDELIDEESIFDDWETWEELIQGDAMSEIQQTPSPTAVIVKRPTVSPAPTPVITDEPEMTTPPLNSDDDEIIELPEVTLIPEVTATPEPEVILDPNGPVLVTKMEKNYVTTSFMENITVTAYDPSGEKLGVQYFDVKLNDSPIYPALSFNGSFSYTLNYKDGYNKLVINVSDMSERTKTYEYEIYYFVQDTNPAIISVDAASIGMGYMIEPTAVDIVEGKTVAAYVKEILSQNSYSTFSKGSQNSHYEFRGLYRPDLFSKLTPYVSDNVLNEILKKADYVTPSSYFNNFIKNGYFFAESKWIFEINGVKYFDSMSNYTLNEGDVLKVRFTLHEGIDLDYIDSIYLPSEEIEETN